MKANVYIQKNFVFILKDFEGFTNNNCDTHTLYNSRWTNTVPVYMADPVR